MAGAPRRDGRTGVLVLLGLVVAALVAALVGLLFLEGDRRTDTEAGPGGERATPEVASGTRPAASGPTTSTDARRATEAPTSDDLPLGPGIPKDPTRFDGRGVLRGHVQAVETRGPVADWHLELVPSRFYAGAEHAEGRTLRYTAEEFDFRVENLPYGAYDVRAVAAGFNGSWVSVVLDKKNAESFVNLTLLPAGFLEGQVVDGAGTPLEGVPLVLVAEADGARFEVVSDAFGRYRFDRVPDGGHRLHVGPPESPLRDAERLDFRAPSMTLPPIELAGLATLVVSVVDETETPVVDAHVTGSAPGLGAVDGRTDVNGTLVLNHLGAGRARLRVEHPAHGDERRSVDLVAGAERALVFHLRPPR